MNAAVRAAVASLSGVLPSAGVAIAEHVWFRPSARRPVVTLPTAADRFEMTVARRRLEGYTLGDGAPVLMVHGWGGAAADLLPLARAIAGTGRRAVAVDLPGHGADRGARTDLFRMAGAIDAVTALHGIPEAVVAHSFGAPATLASFPHGGPCRLVLLAPAFPGEGFAAGFARHIGLGARAEQRFVRRFSEFAGPHLLAIVDGEVTVPGAEVLVLHDPADRRTSFEESRRFADRHPGTHLVPLPGVGHQGILGDPLTAHHVASFLAAASPAGAGGRRVG